MNFHENMKAAANSARSWKLASLALMISTVALSYGLVKSIGSTKVVIVPYAALMQGSNIEIYGVPSKDMAYLNVMATSDIQIISSWTPQSIDSQYQMIEKRILPELFVSVKEELTGDASFYKKNAITQVFFPQKKIFLGDSAIRVTGMITRYSGGKELLSMKASYDVTYQHVEGGIYMISGLKIYKDNEAPSTPGEELSAGN